MPLVRYTVGMVTLIIALVLVVSGTIIYQNHGHTGTLARAHDCYLYSATVAGDALRNLASIRLLLVTDPAASYARTRDLMTYHYSMSESIEELFDLEATYGPCDSTPTVERLRQQWLAFQAGTEGLGENQPQTVRAFRHHEPALELTLRQLHRQYTIAHDDAIAELAHERRTGARTVAIVLVAALTIGVGYGAKIFGLISRSVKRRLRLERTLRDYQDHLEEKVAERTVELETSNKELKAFSYSVSHDLRSPLRAIDGFCHALADKYSDVLDDTGVQYLERIRSSTQRMGKLIDDMLSLSQISRAPFRPAEIDLAPMAREIVSNLRRSTPGRHVKVDIAESLPCLGDVGLLRIAMDNLLGNACKYTSKTANAHIRFDAEDRDGETVYRVSDNGAGFDMGLSDKLFEAFQRLHRQDEFEGTGIGLATVARIVQRHRGRMRGKGEIGKGATFYFTLGMKPDTA
jgi:signal transduction histidine kinase